MKYIVKTVAEAVVVWISVFVLTLAVISYFNSRGLNIQK